MWTHSSYSTPFSTYPCLVFLKLTIFLHNPPKDNKKRIYGDTTKAPLDAPTQETLPSVPARRVLKGPESISQLQQGELFLATIPFNGSEPISLMKFIEYDIPHQNKAISSIPVIAQWMGHHPHEHYIDTRFHNQRWCPGWYQPNTGEFYFKLSPLHKSHVPFTNVISVDTPPY